MMWVRSDAVTQILPSSGSGTTVRFVMSTPRTKLRFETSAWPPHGCTVMKPAPVDCVEVIPSTATRLPNGRSGPGISSRV